MALRAGPALPVQCRVFARLRSAARHSSREPALYDFRTITEEEILKHTPMMQQCH